MPLHDIRILDLTRGLSGSLATKYLANYGAEVVKIEPPEGDPMKLSENPVKTDVPSPTLGQDTKAILLGLGYRQEELDDMKQHNIIAWEE